MNRRAFGLGGAALGLASRLEGITNEYRGRIVISEGTYREVADKFVCPDLDKIRVKGKNLPAKYWVDVRYLRAMAEADAATLDDLIDDLVSGAISWDEEKHA